MGSEGQDPVDCYRGALAVGDDLLRVLREPLNQEALELIEELVGRREDLIVAAGVMLSATGTNGHLRPALEVLIEQQRAVESHFIEALAALRASVGRTQSTRVHMGAVRKLLGRQVRTGSFDQRG